MNYGIRHAHILDTPILGPKVGAAKAAPTAPCAPGLGWEDQKATLLAFRLKWRIVAPLLRSHLSPLPARPFPAD